MRVPLTLCIAHSPHCMLQLMPPPHHCSAAVAGVVVASECSTKSTQTYFHIVMLRGDPAPGLVSLTPNPIQSKILARQENVENSR